VSLGLAACVETVDFDEPPPSSGGQQSGASAPLAVQGQATFTDSEGGYELRYPDSWSLQDRRSSKGFIRADVSKGREVGIQVRLDRAVEVDFETYVDRYRERFTKGMAGHWKGSFGETTRHCGLIGAHQGCRLREVFTRGDGEAWLFLQYLWPSGSDVIILECGTKLSARLEHEPQLETIAESLRLLKP
jgi:hypothetical protein